MKMSGEWKKEKGGKAGVGCTRRLEVGREHQQQNMIHASTIIAGRREGGKKTMTADVKGTIKNANALPLLFTWRNCSS